MKISKSIVDALCGQSKLTADILAIDGMSSRFVRYLLNNLGATFESFNYLEVGVHKGSTYVSSLYKNNVNKSWAIDDWSQFQDQSIYFLENCKRFEVPANFIASDCFTVDTKEIRDVDFYFYDGNHWTEQTAKGLTYFYDSFADSLLYVVDDYDWEEVQQGVELGIKACGFKIKYKNYLESKIANNVEGWWNGLGIFILEK